MTNLSVLLQKKHRWLVTGAAGFIGYHTVKALLDMGQVVIGVDNFATGQREKITQLTKHAKAKDASFSFHELDVKTAAGAELFKEIDFVIHLAAIPSVDYSLREPVLTAMNNTQGFVSVLDKAKAAGVRRVVYASSSAVYGDSKECPAHEERIGKPLSPYALQKLENELWAGIYSRCYGLSTVGLRYFNVFGSGQDPRSAYAAVIPLWMNAFRAGEAVYINGDGRTTRDFCFIGDVVNANIASALSEKIAANEAVSLNIGSGKETSLLDLVAALRGLFPGSKSAVTHREFRAGDVRNSCADLTLARKKIDFSPSESFSEGLRKLKEEEEKNV